MRNREHRERLKADKQGESILPCSRIRLRVYVRTCFDSSAALFGVSLKD